MRHTTPMIRRGLAIFAAVATLTWGAAVQAQQTETKTNPHQAHAEQMMQDMTTQMNAMIPEGDPDVNFAVLMIEHHKSGIAMAKEYLKHGKDDKLRSKAQKMIDQQEKDNKELRERREANEKSSGEAKKDTEKKNE
jgi:uncharacterized protein (DUF305 family)